MKFDDVIRKRQSIRSYSDRKISWKQVAEILNVARFAPMAGNINTLRMIVIDDPKTITKLASASTQNFISEAKYIIVVCSDNSQLTRSYSERGLKYSRQQAGAAIQNMLLKITDMRLASCWIGAFDDNAVKNLLTIPNNIEVEALLPIAYTHSKDRPRTKANLKNLLYFDKWKKTQKKLEKKPEAL